MCWAGDRGGQLIPLVNVCGLWARVVSCCAASRSPCEGLVLFWFLSIDLDCVDFYLWGYIVFEPARPVCGSFWFLVWKLS